MVRRPANNIYINDVCKTEFYNTDKERIKIVTEFERKNYRILEVVDERNMIIYSHRMEAGAFH